jgi:protein transport protein SEC31
VGSPPISGTLNIDLLEVSSDLAPVKDALLGFVAALQAVQLTPIDKRQLTEAEKGVAILVKKLARGDLGNEVVARVSYMVGALCNRDYATATASQTSLVNSDWRTEKDWLKGIKLLIQLASKKF